MTYWTEHASLKGIKRYTVTVLSIPPLRASAIEAVAADGQLEGWKRNVAEHL